MTSKSRDLTENTPPLSFEEDTGAKAQPSKLSASSDNTPSSTPIMKTQSPDMLSTDKNDLTTPMTTLVTTEKSRQHAVILKVALRQLEKAGLIKRFRVLSAGSTTVQKIRIEFDLSIWTEELELKP